MGINPVQALAIQTSFLKKVQNLVMLGQRCHRECLEQIHNFQAIPKIPAGQLPNHEWVAKYGALIQKIG